MNMDLIAQGNMAEFIRSCKSQLEDPSLCTVISFHNHGGVALPNAVVDPILMILKPCGDPLTALAINACHPAHVAFATLGVLLDFGVFTGGYCTLSIMTVVKLPQSIR